MNVPIDKFKTQAGERLNDNLAYHAYRAYIEGRRDEARLALINAHYDDYFGTRPGGVTTDKMVSQVYEKRGLTRPDNRKEVDLFIVKKVVAQRVDTYLMALDEIVKTGRITRAEPLRASMVNGEFILQSCGYNDITAWAAAGHEMVPDVVIVPAKEITVGACWDGSDYYPPQYVNILYQSVLRNTTIPFDFVLYVGPEATKNGKCDAINENVKIVQVGLPYWWCGMPFWEKYPPGVETDSVLYLDLDQVIVGNLDHIIRYPADHVYMKDYPDYCCPPGREKDGNASVTLLRNGAGAAIWTEYDRLGRPVWNPLNPPADRKLPLAVQTILNESPGEKKHNVFPENWVSSYRLWVSKFGLPEDCRVVSFHGQPKPAGCLDQQWVRDNWHD